MKEFIESPKHIKSRLLRIRIFYLAKALIAIFLLFWLNLDSGSFLGFALAILSGSGFIFFFFSFFDKCFTTPRKVVITEEEVVFGERVYPIEKITNISIKRNGFGLSEIEIKATEMSPLKIPIINNIEVFIDMVKKLNPNAKIVVSENSA